MTILNTDSLETKSARNILCKTFIGINIGAVVAVSEHGGDVTLYQVKLIKGTRGRNGSTSLFLWNPSFGLDEMKELNWRTHFNRITHFTIISNPVELSTEDSLRSRVAELEQMIVNLINNSHHVGGTPSADVNPSP